MRKFIFALLFLLGVAYVIGQIAEVKSILLVLRQGDLRFILLGLLVQLLWLINVAVSYRVIYQLLGLKETLSKLTLLAAAAFFINVVAPTAGLGGMAIFVAEARRRAYSSARVTVAGILFVMFDYFGFLCVLALGLLVLFRRNNLNSAELIASGVLLVIASVMAFLIFLGMNSPARLGNVLAASARRINRLLHLVLHRDYLSEARAHEFAQEISDALHQVRSHPFNLLLPAMLGLSSKLLLLLVLYLVFLALRVPSSAGTLVGAFSIGYLFLIVSPTPAGLGVVEGALTLALGSMYVPLSAAAAITLAYRGITFWIPLAFGSLALRRLHN